MVEDNELNRQVALGLLTHLGAQVDLANSGVEAVDKLIGQEAHYDLVFMDMQMPDMDGLQNNPFVAPGSAFRALAHSGYDGECKPCRCRYLLGGGHE